MTEKMSDSDLDALLAGLRRERASDGFTAAVLATVAAEGRPAPRPLARWLVAAAATVAVVLATALLTRGPAAPAPGAASAGSPSTERARLRAETRALARELAALRDALDRPAPEPPLLYLGGDERLDLVLDLGPILEARSVAAGGGPPGTPRPAAAGHPNGGIR